MTSTHVDQEVQEIQPEIKEIPVERVTQLFNTRDRVKTITNLQSELHERRRLIVPNDDISKQIESRISALSPDEIRELPDAAIAEIYNLDGEEVQFSLDLESKAQEIEFRRDFLAFLKESSMIHDQIDSQMDELNEELEKGQAELAKVLADFGDISEFMRSKLVEEMESATGERKEKVTEMLKAFDDSGELTRVVSHYEKFGTRNTIEDYLKRSEVVYAKYIKVLKELDVKTDLTNFNNLEEKFLEEKYQTYPNLFLFSVIKQYAYKKGNVNTAVDGVFLSQLSVNIQSLFADSFATPEKKEKFLDGIRKTLDLFY